MSTAHGKGLKHSAKALPSAALGIGHLEKKKSAKPSLPSVICRALGKAFAECRPNTRQRKVAINHDGCFAECLKDDTRQRIYIIFFPKLFAECRLSAKNFLFFLKKSLCRVPWPDTRQSLPLCRVSWPDTRQILPLCRVPWPDTRQSLPICRVPWPDTRQRAQLCRVSLQLHSAKLGNLVFSSSFCQLCRVQWPLHSAKRPLPSVTLGKASIITYFFLVFIFQHFHHTFKQKISQIFITFFKSMTFITYISQTPFRSHKHKCLNISHRNSQVQKLFII